MLVERVIVFKPGNKLNGTLIVCFFTLACTNDAEKNPMSMDYALFNSFHVIVVVLVGVKSTYQVAVIAGAECAVSGAHELFGSFCMNSSRE